MVFSTTNLFKGIDCPEGATCRLTSCIYAHDQKLDTTSRDPTSSSALNASNTHVRADAPVEPATKRRKVTYNTLAEKPPSRADLIRSSLAVEKGGASRQTQDSARVSRASTASIPSSTPPHSLVSHITPPRANRAAEPSPTTSASGVPPANNSQHTARPEKVESLNPRLVTSDPVGHSKRGLFLKHLHAEVQRLNQLIHQSSVEAKDTLALTAQQVITMALDMEEKIVRDSGSVYGNVIKQRIAALKKMAVDDWVKEVKERFLVEESPPVKQSSKPIETGLPIEHESLILPQLVADQKALAAYGYIASPPSEQEAATAKAAVEASQNWEICDRCSARFQVFPDRNAEGLLCGNGPCRFHPNRKVFPQRTKADKHQQPKEPYHPCCSEAVGSPGCTTNAEHVFKTSSPARLASVLPFITTPENPSPRKDRNGKDVQAVTFDCEMGYTTYGLELIRLTAVAWPTQEQLIDVLVRPLGTIIDLNSRFSGIFPGTFVRSIPYDEWEKRKPPPASDTATPRLPIVSSPQKARDILCAFITPTTPLIGHAIDNDLNTVRLCHPTIVDTVVLFPHPRGLPLRFGLKMLTSKHLSRSIQNGGDRGHDSLEDAVATGDLVRVKVGMKWKELRLLGWTIDEVDGTMQLIPPDNKGEGVGGVKRRRGDSSDGEGENGHGNGAAA